MNPTPGSDRNRPALWAATLVRVGAAALPRGIVRDRYRKEFLSDLHGMSRREQAAYSTRVLALVVPLRIAVRSSSQQSLEKGSDMVFHRRRPLLCRFNVHHDWHGESTPDGGRYVRCTRCGKDATGPIPMHGDAAARAKTIAGLTGSGLTPL
jgi:hypothetical protein